MSDLTLRSRRAAIEGLQRLSDELAQASTWLDGFEDDQEASKACLLLEEAPQQRPGRCPGPCGRGGAAGWQLTASSALSRAEGGLSIPRRQAAGLRELRTRGAVALRTPPDGR